MLTLPDQRMTIIQNAWVTDDLARTAGYWSGLGVGPFFTMTIAFTEAHFRGVAMPLTVDLALAQAGDLQIEIIRQVGDAPSVFNGQFADGARQHHVCRQGGDYDAMMATLLDAGVEIVAEMRLGDHRIAFADTRAIMGCLLEFQDVSAAVTAFNTLALDAAASWDGSEPLRPLDPSVLA